MKKNVPLPGSKAIDATRIQDALLDVGEPPEAAVARVQRADVIDHAGHAVGRVERAGGLVVVHPGHRPDRSGRQVLLRRDRKLADLGEVAPLEVALEGDPVLPRLLQREAEHLLELVGIVALARLRRA